jgi:outer membrane protein, adhesin transport system
MARIGSLFAMVSGRLVWHSALIAIMLGLASMHASHAQDAAPSTTVQPVLSQLVEQAVRAHPSVLAKLAELGGSQANVDNAKWQYYPSLTVQTERSSNQTNRSVPSTSSSLIRLQQTLWTGGRLDAGTRNVEFKHQAAYHVWQEARYTVALRTVEAWQRWLTAMGRQEAALQLLVQLERLSGMMDRRVEQQVSPAIDAQLLRARLAQAQSERLAAQAALEAARQHLVQWTGDSTLAPLPKDSAVAAGATAMFQRPHDELPTLSADTAQKLDAAVARAPTALRSEADARAAEAELQQRQAEQWPSVYARLDRQFNSGGFFGKTVDNTASVGLQYTLGAGLSVRAQVEVAQAKVQSLHNEREALLRQLQDNYRSEWRDYQNTVERIQYAQSVRSSNATLLESYTRLFVAGRRSWLELLNSLREQNAAEQALTDLQAQQQAGYFRLRLYLGELPWQSRTTP